MSAAGLSLLLPASTMISIRTGHLFADGVMRHFFPQKPSLMRGAGGPHLMDISLMRLSGSPILMADARKSAVPPVTVTSATSSKANNLPLQIHATALIPSQFVLSRVMHNFHKYKRINQMRNLFPLISPAMFILTVIVLGFITPGYNHMSHTISRLAITKYGWIQVLNFLQLAMGMLYLGISIARTMRQDASKKTILLFFSFTACVLVLAALTPVDPIDNMPFNISILTPNGIVHTFAVLLFLFVSPSAIRSLTRIFLKEEQYRSIAHSTAIFGYIAFILSLVWIICFVLGFGLEYRGFFQKLIVLWVCIWIILLNLRVLSSMEHA